MRLLTHLITGGIATTVILAGTAVTAQAQSDKITDKRADVVQYDGLDEDSGSILNQADSNASGINARSATVKHSKKSLKVTIRFADLTRKHDSVSVFANIQVKGKKTPKYAIYSISRKKVGVFTTKDMEQVCTGKQSRKAGKNGNITFTIARSCIKKPKTIKVQTGVVRFIQFDEENFSLYQDVISSSKVRTPDSTKWLKAS